MARVGALPQLPLRTAGRIAALVGVLLVGVLIGMLALPVLPQAVQDWAYSGQQVVSDIAHGGVAGRQGSSSATSVRYSGVVVPRPDWCPSDAEWRTGTVPQYAAKVPACATSSGTIYLGYWPLPGCSPIGVVPARRGVVTTKNQGGTVTGVDVSVATSCKR